MAVIPGNRAALATLDRNGRAMRRAWVGKGAGNDALRIVTRRESIVANLFHSIRAFIRAI